jgi:hypothetical protein
VTTATTGGCLCGAVRYEYTGALGPSSYCHCRDCQHVTGSAFNVGVRCELGQFRLVRGAVREYSKRADSGTVLTRAFCGDCGSPLFTSSPAHPAHVYIKAGSLDDPRPVLPAHQSWLDSAVPWSRIDPALPGYRRGRTP